MRRLALPAVLLLTLLTGVPALAGPGLPKLASLTVGPYRATVWNDSPQPHTDANTFTVAIPDLPGGHLVTLTLTGPQGQRIGVPLYRLRVLEGPADAHGGDGHGDDGHADDGHGGDGAHSDDGHLDDGHAHAPEPAAPAAAEPCPDASAATAPAKAPGQAPDATLEPAPATAPAAGPNSHTHADGRDHTHDAPGAAPQAPAPAAPQAPRPADPQAPRPADPQAPAPAQPEPACTEPAATPGRGGAGMAHDDGPPADYDARGTVVLGAEGDWTATLRIEDHHGGAWDAQIEFAAVRGGPNRLYLGMTGLMMGGTIAYGLVQRRRSRSDRR